MMCILNQIFRGQANQIETDETGAVGHVYKFYHDSPSDEATWETFAILNTQGVKVRVVFNRVRDRVQGRGLVQMLLHFQVS
jgi:hypothetical protein